MKIPRWANLANLFTLARLLIVPFATQAILRGDHQRALILVLIAGLTDGIDGALARRFGMMTQAGAYFDPIVDKIFLSAIYIALAITTIIPWWLVAVIFGRDFVLLAASLIAIGFFRLRRFPPSIWGKGSTVLQIAVALLAIIQHAPPPDPAIWAVAALTFLSGIHYLWRGLRATHKQSKPVIDGGLARE